MKLLLDFFIQIQFMTRQSTHALTKLRSCKKLLLILTGGKPNDIDHFESHFGIEDTYQAILAAKRLVTFSFLSPINEQQMIETIHCLHCGSENIVKQDTQKPEGDSPINCNNCGMTLPQCHPYSSGYRSRLFKWAYFFILLLCTAMIFYLPR